MLVAGIAGAFVGYLITSAHGLHPFVVMVAIVVGGLIGCSLFFATWILLMMHILWLKRPSRGRKVFVMRGCYSGSKGVALESRGWLKCIVSVQIESETEPVWIDNDDVIRIPNRENEAPR